MRLLELPHDWTALIIVALGRLKAPRAAAATDDAIREKIDAVTTRQEGEAMMETTGLFGVCDLRHAGAL